MLRAAIFGAGTWGQRLIDSVQGSEKFRFVKGISRDPKKHSELAQKTGIKFVSSYGRVLKDPEIDAVYIPLLEEPDLEVRFGESYREYRRHVPRLLPRLRPWNPG